MSQVRICDVCSAVVDAPHKIIKVLDHKDTDEAPRDYKTVGSLDLHNDCYEKLLKAMKSINSPKNDVAPIERIGAHQ